MGRVEKCLPIRLTASSRMLLLRQALGCGIPVGAFAARGRAADVLKPVTMHHSWMVIIPLAGAAVEVVLDIYEQN